MRGNVSFCKWRAQYGGMDASLISQMKAMEEENRRLRRIYADLSMQAGLLVGLTDAGIARRVRVATSTVRRYVNAVAK